MIEKENSEMICPGHQAIPDGDQKEQIACKIRSIAAARGEKMAHWAVALGLTRQAVYHVVSGRRKTAKTRAFIANRLGQEFWKDEEAPN